MGMKMVSSLLSVLVLNVLWMAIGYAAPLLDATDAPAVSAPTTKCSPDGQCWGWLSTLETHGDAVVVADKENDTSNRLQSRRQTTSPASEFALKSWQDSTLATTEQVIRPLESTNKQIPIRITKKDVFSSRSWGGGMPFSVLYMNPHYPRSNTVTAKSTTQRPELNATTRSSSLSSVKRNYQRKRQLTVQPRRQFFTIPQLFISYGWDGYGK